MHRKLFVVALAGLSAVLLAAGCGTAPRSTAPKTGASANGGSPGAGGGGGGGTLPPPGMDAQPSANPAAGPGLRAADSAVLGKIVVDGRGMTVYRSEKDTAQPPKSTCVAACATQWPPVRHTADLKIEGIDPKLIGKLARADGVTQVTIAGWPVYLFSGDAKAGDIKGQGQGGVWFAIAPTGARIGAPAPAKSGSGY